MRKTETIGGTDMFSKAEIGIDLGTANILIYSEKKGVILNEPAIVAIDVNTNGVIAVGNEARAMVGKTPRHIAVIKPLHEGVIANFDVSIQMLTAFLDKASRRMGMSLRKPTIVVCTPSGSTSVERRAIRDALMTYGAKAIHLIEEPIAAAIGTGLPVDEPLANVIVDIGGGTSESGIISFGGVVASSAVKVGGDNLDKDIKHYMRKKYNILIGERTAENIKVEIGNADPNHLEVTMEVRGRDVVSGLPNTIVVTSTEIHQAIQLTLEKILDGIRSTLENCPPELSGDIVDNGIVLTGGGALLNGVKEWLTSEIDVPVHLAPSPLESVAIGTGKSLKMITKVEIPL